MTRGPGYPSVMGVPAALANSARWRPMGREGEGRRGEGGGGRGGGVGE